MWDIQLKMTWDQRVAIIRRLRICLRGRREISVKPVVHRGVNHSHSTRTRHLSDQRRRWGWRGRRGRRCPGSGQKKKKKKGCGPASGSRPSKRSGRSDKAVGLGEGVQARSGGHNMQTPGSDWETAGATACPSPEPASQLLLPDT